MRTCARLRGAVSPCRARSLERPAELASSPERGCLLPTRYPRRTMGLRLGLETLAARGVGAVSRAAGRGSGTTLPGKLLWKVDPGAVDALAARLPAGVASSPGRTARRPPPRWRRASSAATAAWLGIARGRTSSLASRPPSSPRTAPSSASSRSTRPLSRRRSSGRAPVRCCSRTSSATSSIATASSRSSLSAGAPRSRGCPTRRCSSWTPTIRSSQTSPMVEARAALRARRSAARAARVAARRGFQVLPALRDAVPLRGRVCRPPRRVPLPRRAGTPGPSSTSPRSTSTPSACTAPAFVSSRPAARSPVELALPGLYNVYNAVAASALALALETPPDAIRRGLEGFSAAFGRFERIPAGGKRIVMLLIKNPAGANEALRTLETGIPPVLVIALNDAIADGRDVSWIWDVDFEPILPHVERVVASGERSAELGLRLVYGGLPEEQLEIVPGAGGRPRPWAGAGRSRHRARRAPDVHRDARAPRRPRRARPRPPVLGRESP